MLDLEAALIEATYTIAILMNAYVDKCTWTHIIIIMYKHAGLT